MNKLIAIFAVGVVGCAFSATQTSKEYVDARVGEVSTSVSEHVADSQNPHNVTAGQVGAYTKDEADAEFLKDETDPNVPDWAKMPNPPQSAVTSVNDKNGDVILDANDVGAYSKEETDAAIASATPGDYANVSNKAYSAVQEETDPNVPEWAKRVNKPTYAAHEVGAVADDEIYANVSNKAFQAAEAHEHSVVWITPINRGVLPSGVDSELTRMGEYSLGAAQFNLATYGMRDRDDTIMKKATESCPGFDGSVYKFTNLFYYTSRIVSQGLNTRTYYDWWGNFFLDWDNITGNKPNADKLWNTERTVFQDVFGGVYEITRSEKFDFVSHDYGYLYTNVEWNVLVVESASRFLRSTWFYGDTDGWSHVIIRNKSTDLRIQNVSWKRIIYLRGTVRETDLSDCTEDYPDTLVFNFPSGGGSYVVHSVYDSYTNKISQVLYSGDVEPPGDYANVSNKAMTAMQPTNTYNKDETDALIAANKPEYEDLASNVVWRIEADGARFFFKPVRPVHTED